jgi:hypothetical protein
VGVSVVEQAHSSTVGLTQRGVEGRGRQVVLVHVAQGEGVGVGGACAAGGWC